MLSEPAAPSKGSSSHERVAQSFEVAARRAAACYAFAPRFARGFVKGKLVSDPVHAQAAERAPLPAPVLDIGCGYGQMLLMLAMVQPELRATGLDWDEAKIRLARKASESLPELEYRRCDVRAVELPQAASILMIDVLHYLPVHDQDALLERARAALRPGGVILLRECDAGRRVRSAVTRVQERLGALVGVHRAQQLCYRPASELMDRLKRLGMGVSIKPCWGRFPLANVLLEARLPTR